MQGVRKMGQFNFLTVAVAIYTSLNPSNPDALRLKHSLKSKIDKTYNIDITSKKVKRLVQFKNDSSFDPNLCNTGGSMDILCLYSLDHKLTKK